MENLLLKVNLREEVGKGVDDLREKGQLPSVLYGRKLDNKNLAVKETDFIKVYRQAGESTLVDLQIGEAKPVKVLIQEVQHDAIKHQIIHVDFYQVKMDEKITASIPLVYIGESPAVKGLGAVLVTSMAELQVKCLPADLVKEIAVDLSVLKNFGDKIAVRDLPISDKIEVLTHADITVASAAEPREEEVEVKPVAAEAVEGAAAAGAVPAEGEAKAAEGKPAAESKGK